MNCIVNFEKVQVSGGFSFEITDCDWTSEDIVKSIQNGACVIPHIIDGGPIFCQGKIIAKIVKALPKFNFENSSINFEKNTNTPYFFGFEDKDEVLSYFHQTDDFFNDKEILLATKHVQTDGYGNFLVILKNPDNRLYYTHIEDTIRTRNGPNKFYSEHFQRINLNEKRHLIDLGFAREYQEVIDKILTHGYIT